MGPHKMINSIYGPILKGGNISCIVARTGVGKTNFTIDYAMQTGLKYSIPVLHFDNGEMSETEIIMRQCAALSGVPLTFLEDGKWRQNEDFVKKVVLPTSYPKKIPTNTTLTFGFFSTGFLPKMLLTPGHPVQTALPSWDQKLLATSALLFSPGGFQSSRAFPR